MSVSSFYSQVSSQSQDHDIRQLVFVVGDATYQQTHLDAFLTYYPMAMGLGHFHALTFNGERTMKGKQLLGTESSAVVIACDPFSVDDFACVAGTICGGGVLLVLLTEAQVQASYFLQRLKNTHSLSGGVYWCEANLVIPPILLLVNQHNSVVFNHGMTSEQENTVEAIERVAFGHRYRPLVVTADRGRGKSHALALAALRIASKASLTVLVISGHVSAVTGLFRVIKDATSAIAHSNTKIQVGESWVQFAAMDAVLSGEVVGDVCLVDEAATIPVPLLLQLAKSHPRVVYSSTLHGYEGTGKGFGLTFLPQLRLLMKQVQTTVLTKPIRWADKDPLELWLNQALLLDAEVPSYNKAPFDGFQIRRFSHQNVWSETVLSSVFALLVQAHYQTCPSDLVQILDDKDTDTWVVFSNDQVLGACVVKREGEIDASLTEAIVLGQRRVRGHLLPQSLAGHLGISEPLSQVGYRIQRIVVHSECRRKGVALSLLNAITEWAKINDIDYLGSSFAYNESVADFWLSSSWSSVRLGISKDKSSGCHSMMVVKPISSQSEIWVEQAQMLFAINFLSQANETFSNLPVRLFLRCYCLSIENMPMTFPHFPLITDQIRGFAKGGFGYELICGSLTIWTQYYLMHQTLPEVLSLSWQVMVRKVLQKQTWQKVAQDLKLAGRREVEGILREWYRSTLEIYTVNNGESAFTV